MGWLDLVSPDRGQGGGLLGSYAAPVQQPGLAAGSVPAEGTGNYQNAWLGYLAGALQGGNLGQSIGRGLEGWMQGSQLDQRRQVQQQSLAAASKPAFGVIGEDGNGRKMYGFIDAGERKVTPLRTGSASRAGEKPTRAAAAAYPAPIDPATAASLQALLDGRLTPARWELSDPSWQRLLEHAAHYQLGSELARRYAVEAAKGAPPSRDAAGGER